MPATAAKPALEQTQSEMTFKSPMTVQVTACLLLVLLTLGLYNGAAHNGFANYDDDRYVTTNAHVRAGLSWVTIRWAFTSFDEANWHPLTWLSHALDCQLYELNPAGHHYTSLLFHASNAVLLFLLLAAATRSKWRSLMVAALFAVHPLNVESVAWIAERKSVLAMFFFLLTLWAYGWYGKKPGIHRYLLVAGGFAMALMSKPMVITLPFALLLLDYWPLERLSISDGSFSYDTKRFSFRRLCVEKIPLLALSAGSAALTFAAQRAGGAVTFNVSSTPWLRAENAIVCYAVYILKAFWPTRLAILYPYPHTIALWKVAASGLFLLGVTAMVIRYRERRYLPVGWFWYLGTMVPMVGVIQVGNQAMADRYAYLPLVGILVMVVWGVADCIASLRSTSNPTSEFDAIKIASLAAAACVIAALFAASYKQISYWRDDLTLWTHTLSVTGPNWVAENNVGAVLAQQGRVEEGVAHFRVASALEPDDAVSQLNLGVYAQQHNNLDEAITRYQAALQFATDSRTRASAYANLGQIYYTRHDYTNARQNLEAAAKLNNPYPILLGLLAQRAGEWNIAAQYYAYALSMSPSDVGFLLLEQALRASGREQDAVRAHQQAERFSQDLLRAQAAADQLVRR